MAIAHVKTDGGTGSGLTFLDVAQTGGCVAGDLLIVCLRSVSKTFTYTVTDTMGNSYTPFPGHPLRGNTGSIYCAYAKAASTGANTVRGTYSSADNPGVMVSEFSGIDVDAGIDTHAEASGNTSTVSSGNGATTAVADELIFGAFQDPNDTGNTRTVGSGFTSPTNGNNRCMVEYKIVSSIAAYAATGSLSYNPGVTPGNQWNAIMASFNAPVTVGNWPDLTIKQGRPRSHSAFFGKPAKKYGQF